MKKRGIKQKGNGATDHILVELDTACRDADGTKSNCALRERGGRSGPGRVSRARADGEGRTANVMQSDLRHQGLKVRGDGTVWTSECRGGESTAASGPGKGWN
jgi:hypothetical protein